MQDQSGSSQHPLVKDLLFFGEGIDEGLENVFYLHLFFFFFLGKGIDEGFENVIYFHLNLIQPELNLSFEHYKWQARQWVGLSNLFGPNQGDPLINQTKIQPPELIGRVETRSKVSHSENIFWRGDMYNIYEVLKNQRGFLKILGVDM